MHTTDALPEALRDALGQIIADQRREWRRERELIEAQSREIVAQLRAEVVELRTAIKEDVSARLASLRDGKDGAPGRDGIDGAPGRNGTDGAPGRDGVDGLPGRDGADGKNGETGAPGRDGLNGDDGKAGRDGADGKDGADGARGADGAPGKLPVAKEWTARVHYEGDVVTHTGSTYQAVRDTGGEPPSADWQLLAMKGADARGFNARGTFEIEATYARNDVVAFNGSSFVALKDAPGACPGEGWQLLASAGRRGKEGPPGREGNPGKEGRPGKAGVSLVTSAIDDMSLVLTDSEGARFRADLTPIAEQILAAAR
jgi:hypothetical protein